MTNSPPDAPENNSGASDTQPASSPGGAEAREEIASRPAEAAEVLASGPKAGNRAGALAFLAAALVIGGAVHFYMTMDSHIQSLDAALLRHAELSLGASGEDAAVAIAPTWPFALYESLRGDIALYAAVAAAAAYLWHLAARGRARRDAFLLHDRLSDEVAGLRRRVALLEERAGKQDPGH